MKRSTMMKEDWWGQAQAEEETEEIVLALKSPRGGENPPGGEVRLGGKRLGVSGGTNLQGGTGRLFRRRRVGVVEEEKKALGRGVEKTREIGIDKKK